jgi:hypothetical protein
VVVLVQDEVEAGPLEIRMKQEMRVGNDNGVRRCMAVHGIDMKMGLRRPALAIRRNRGVKFASVIQWATAIGLIFT